MATVVPISTLTDKSKRMKVHAKVIKLWPAINYKNGNMWGMNFVLLDEKETPIQGTMYSEDYQRVSSEFVEGHICEIGRFTVKPVNPSFQTIKHSFNVLFTKETFVKQLPPDLYDIPEYYFNFKELEDIGKTITGDHDIIDVIGIIAGFSAIETRMVNQKETRIQTICLKNERGHTVDITLWEDFIDKLNVNSLHEKSKTGAIIVACSSVQINKFRGSIGLKSYVGSKFITDSEIEPIKKFLERLPTEEIPTSIELDSIRRSYSSSSATEQKSIEVSLADLLTMALENYKDNLFKCTSTIIDINKPFEWYYDGCPKCNKKIQDPFKSTAWCSSCKMKRTNHVPCYRVTVQVKDSTGEAEFVLIGNTATKIIGQDAKTTKNEVKPDPEEAPDALLKLIGKTYVFIVSGKHATTYQIHRNYTVKHAHEVIMQPTLLSNNIIDLEGSAEGNEKFLKEIKQEFTTPEKKNSNPEKNQTPVTPIAMDIVLKDKRSISSITDDELLDNQKPKKRLYRGGN